MDEDTQRQIAAIKENLQEAGYFESQEDAIKKYRELQNKFQKLVREYNRQSDEFRKVTRHLANHIDMLTQDNNRLYMENASLSHRQMELISRLSSYEEKRLPRTICIPNMIKPRSTSSSNRDD